ncbi:hypothetical protein IQ270_17440 [Microcoleus sp. LEGE 07076]|uniref:Ycf66 family protein n=1 Tax=Microcoleus sp. LEGE 07076 TaxID=915322 RepID=UPI00188098E9|nr:Ycf66 family protein [Microcoleus sp. LEGE 07076]MBE9186417.1 hypothetical protein [Microcoleus sp. LEGE 07076]
MLAYILALAVGLGSFSIYMAAFFFPEVHRKSDFTWSGIGLFYALILWACAGRITGALLLGQMAGVAMLGWFAWETLTLRRLVTPVAQQTPIPKSPNLTGATGGPLSGLFGKKPEPAAKKPKFVRSPKPKADVVPAPAANQSQVKLEEQPATPPVAETIGDRPIAPELTIPEEKAPAVAEIPVFPVETPAAETSPDPAESASSFTPLPPPIEFSEIAAPATVEPAEAQPQPQQQPETDDFEEMWRAKAKESKPAAPTAVVPEAKSTSAKAVKKSGGFGSLFDNIKNSLGGMLGLGADKSKSDANTPATTEKKTPDPIAPESKITAIPAPDLDRILESELAEAASEAAAEISNTAVETSQAVPFPTDVETMADLVAAQTASSAKIEESSIGPDSSADSQTPPAAVGETAAADVPEAPSLEMTVVEMVAVAPVEMEASGQPEEMSGVELVSVKVVSIESTETKPSGDEEQTELTRPTPPTPEIVETAQPAAESKSENLSDEDKPLA